LRNANQAGDDAARFAAKNLLNGAAQLAHAAPDVVTAAAF